MREPSSWRPLGGAGRPLLEGLVVAVAVRLVAVPLLAPIVALLLPAFAGGFVAAYRSGLDARATSWYAFAAGGLLPVVLFAPVAVLLVAEHAGVGTVPAAGGMPHEIALPLGYGYAVLAVWVGCLGAVAGGQTAEQLHGRFFAGSERRQNAFD